MTITYTWSIVDMKTKNETIDGVTYENAVIKTYWIKKGTDENGNVGMYSGVTRFAYRGEGTFIPYEDLTEEIVLGWIQAVVEGYSYRVDEEIHKQINERANRISELGLPWASAPEPTT